LKPLQNPVEYEAKLKQLMDLFSLAKAGFIDLFFADESGRFADAIFLGSACFLSMATKK
jgi:hypothetical protein